ncbi:winged helix-turn-helix domain-containing protein [Micromonospora arborensis]|uniref:winged helix-turn-helix domain-containing protein n=1 Tax=Micromonospora arborensis TaxID=2116518 RepID=UPI003715FFDD
MRSGGFGGFSVSVSTRNRMRPLTVGDDRPVPVQIAERLREAIADGRFGQGDRLPGVNALARYYAVGQHVAYEALLILQADGLVRIVRRIGTFVRVGAGEQCTPSLAICPTCRGRVASLLTGCPKAECRAADLAEDHRMARREDR